MWWAAPIFLALCSRAQLVKMDRQGTGEHADNWIKSI
jgi:hypothetical protein